MGNTIKSIDVHRLWGTYDLHWELSSGVNILAGGNGSGKSTVLRCLGDLFRTGSLSPALGCRVENIRITFDDGSQLDSALPSDPLANGRIIEFVSTFDAELKESEAIYKLSDGSVATYLDWELYRLQNRYLAYQLDVGKRVIAALRAGHNPSDIEKITERKSRFLGILDELFAPTGKRVDRESDSLRFILHPPPGQPEGPGVVILPNQLSSGEKQVIIILASALIHNGHEMIMIMDEPEISLHFEWQKRIIADLLNINPRLQLVIATHSPAMVMNGWTDRVTEMQDILFPAGSRAAGSVPPNPATPPAR